MTFPLPPPLPPYFSSHSSSFFLLLFSPLLSWECEGLRRMLDRVVSPACTGIRVVLFVSIIPPADPQPLSLPPSVQHSFSFTKPSSKFTSRFHLLGFLFSPWVRAQVCSFHLHCVFLIILPFTGWRSEESVTERRSSQMPPSIFYPSVFWCWIVTPSYTRTVCFIV